MAPDLVEIQRYFADDGVLFISLTPDNKPAATEFTRRHGIGWPTGWGAKPLVERYLGDQLPAILVIGRDGRVVWNDGAARLHHRYDVRAALFEQIKKAL